MSADSQHPPGSPETATCRADFFKEIEIEFLIHELKDPISIVETGAKMLLKKQARFGPLTERQTKTINRIVRNAAKARQMLYSLLEVGRAETGSFSCDQFNPGPAGYAVLLECLELHAPDAADKVRNIQEQEAELAFLRTRGIHFTAAADLTNLVVHQDETKFRQIAGNLIKNALHYRSERLEVRLEVEPLAVIVHPISLHLVQDDEPLAGSPDQCAAMAGSGRPVDLGTDEVGSPTGSPGRERGTEGVSSVTREVAPVDLDRVMRAGALAVDAPRIIVVVAVLPGVHDDGAAAVPPLEGEVVGVLVRPAVEPGAEDQVAGILPVLLRAGPAVAEHGQTCFGEDAVRLAGRHPVGAASQHVGQFRH